MRILVYETRDEVVKDIKDWDEKGFRSSTMDRKIELLANYLPTFLVDNRSIYGILSKGIHQLNEDACKEFFPIIQAGIEIILDEKVVKKKRERKVKETSQLINKISADVQGGLKK